MHEEFETVFSYKMNDKVWVMHNNKPHELTVKDAILTIPASESVTNERKFYAYKPALRQYTLKWWCAAMREPILVNEDQCFKTKEELLNSFK